MMESEFNIESYLLLFMSMHFKPQKLDIILKRIEYHLSSASTIRYRRAEVLAKVLLSIDIFEFKMSLNIVYHYFDHL
jgi:hypothetical protein